MRHILITAGLVSLALGLAPGSLRGAPDPAWPAGWTRVRETAPAPFVLAREGRAECDIVLLDDGPLVRHAADWLVDLVATRTGARLPIGGAEMLEASRPHLIVAAANI